MADHVRNQHYIPQFLLRNFCSTDPNKVWSYDKIHKNISERSIQRTASEDFFYDINPGHKEGSFEYILGRAESDTAPVISKIIDTKDLSKLTLDEKVIIALYVWLQEHRTKAGLKETERFNREFFEPIKEFAKATNAKLDLEELPYKQTWLSQFHEAPYMSAFLLKKKWFLVQSDKKFYMSDNPVIRHNPTNSNECRGTLGLDSDGITIYFPLNHSLVLCLFCEKTYPSLTGETITCVPGQLERINSFQVILAERFIFSSQNNFELVQNMMSTGELERK